MLCGVDIESPPPSKPLCLVCANWNFVVRDDDGSWHAFSDEGRYHRSSNGRRPANVTYIRRRR
jgi:hypothetical protein